ncbi:MAG: hypothetical protein M1819_005333 [Sarea resinae]|nr:MAG: hypothetical protein M1819_005333 [Sarea resinae]
MATRIAYALILLVNSILSWVMLTDWAIRKLEHLALDYMKLQCVGHDCYGFVAVHRINFALGTFHVLLAILLLGVKSSRNGRAAIQNGFWGPKIIAWLGFIVLSFLIPDAFFIAWGNYVAYALAICFVLLGLILLVDLAHTWAEYCLDKIEFHDSKAWRGLLIGSTLGMYLGAFALTIIMYIFFAHGGCSMNQAAISVNLVLLLIISFISVHPAVQESNPRAGLAQSAMVAIYCTYLTMSAVSMEPDDKHCNPLIRGRGTRTVSIVIGAIVTMLTIAYTTTRAATQGIAMGSKGNGSYSQLGNEEVEHGLVTPTSSRREMRAEALRAAVESGSLPASALDEDDDDDDDDDGHGGQDDEKGATQYNYSLFHFIFLLATAWVATLLTTNLQEDPTTSGDFQPVGRTYWASWVKIVIGGGVVGLAIARKLSQREGTTTLLLERHKAVGTETSSRNSEVIHAGLYYPATSLKTRLCVRGKELLYALCEEKHIPHANTGKWIVAQTQDEWAATLALHAHAKDIGVPTRIVSRDEARRREPDVRADAGVLESPTTGIVDSHTLMLYLVSSFEDSGRGDVALNSAVTGVEALGGGDGYRIVVGAASDENSITASTVINSAGHGACDVSNLLLPPHRHRTPYFAKGTYFSYSASHPRPSTLVYPAPSSGLGGLGTHLTLDLSGRARFGPDVEWVDSASDLSPNAARLPDALDAIARYLPGLDRDAVGLDYCGIRPKLAPRAAVGGSSSSESVGDENHGDDAEKGKDGSAGGKGGGGFQDFVIRAEEGFPGFVNLLGIESPGLTSSLAIAERVDTLLYP